MSLRHLNGTPPIALHLRRSDRARRITLRVSQLDGRVTLTLPRRVTEADALTFAEEKATWIRKHLAARQDNILVGIGTRLPIEGKDVEIRAGTSRGITQRDGGLWVRQDRAAIQVQAYLKTLARDRITTAADHYARKLGRPYARLQLRDTRSRWGSCSTSGTLSFSWRLVLAAPDVLRYVAAHEVAHLREMNHSPAFWALVTDLYGDYDAPRSWLHRDGATLHRYQFDTGA
jgi:predicted metal-dependent hydrolase